MARFIKYNPLLTAPAFSEKSVIEVKTRDGRVMETDEPWMATGWNHNGGPNDIMEFRLIRGTLSPQQPKLSPVRPVMADIEESARIYCGLPPFRSWSNTSQGDPHFDAACRAKYGDEAWAAAVKKMVENEDAIRRNAEAAAQIDEIAARHGLPINVAGKERDSNVELRGLLKEVLDVLTCHHRNTHKDLIGRVRNYRSQL